jgi:MoaA/NifB/PqqE/SkfB family radical SAM enzyme
MLSFQNVECKPQLETNPLLYCGEYPKALYLELTDRCNLLCPMCRQSAVAGDVLPLETFQEIADTLFPHATFVDLRGWGESTMLPNFSEYLDYSLKFPLKKKLITNATLKNPVNKPSVWQQLGAAGVVVGVSIDAAEPVLYAQLRVGGELTRTIANVQQLIQSAAAAGYEPKQQVYFCITVSGANIFDIKNIIRLGLDLGIDRFKLEPIKTVDQDPVHLQNFTQEVRIEMQTLRQLAQATGARIELSASLVAEDVELLATQKLCIHPWQYLYVNARSRMGFCDHLNGLEEFTFARWGEEDFDRFWNGEKMRQLRQEHLDRFHQKQQISICGDCNWCYDQRYMDLEDWVEPGWSAYRVQL